jgi:HSP20 family molecular chaperone IbpA
MVLTPLRKVTTRLFGSDVTNTRPKSNFDSVMLAKEPEPPVFKVKHYGESIRIEAEMNGFSIENVQIQWNYHYIFLDGEKVHKQRRIKFKEQFEMPKGAIKKGIEAHFIRSQGKFYVTIPIAKEHIPRSDDPVWVDLNM